MNTRKLFLPGGGTFDLVLPTDDSRITQVAPPPTVQGATDALFWPVFGGVLAGGVVGWLIHRWTR